MLLHMTVCVIFKSADVISPSTFSQRFKKIFHRTRQTSTSTDNLQCKQRSKNYTLKILLIKNCSCMQTLLNKNKEHKESTLRDLSVQNKQQPKPQILIKTMTRCQTLFHHHRYESATNNKKMIMTSSCCCKMISTNSNSLTMKPRKWTNRLKKPTSKRKNKHLKVHNKNQVLNRKI